MANIIIILIVIVLLGFALKGTFKHMKGGKPVLRWRRWKPSAGRKKAG